MRLLWRSHSAVLCLFCFLCSIDTAQLRERRPICNPNTGFTFQLLLLQRRLGIPYRRFDAPLAEASSQSRGGLRCDRRENALQVVGAGRALREVAASSQKKAERRAPPVELLRLSVHSARAPDFLLWTFEEGLEVRGGEDSSSGAATAAGSRLHLRLPTLSSRGAYLLLLPEAAWLWFDPRRCLRSAEAVLQEARRYLAVASVVEERTSGPLAELRGLGLRRCSSALLGSSRFTARWP